MRRFKKLFGSIFGALLGSAASVAIVTGMLVPDSASAEERGAIKHLVYVVLGAVGGAGAGTYVAPKNAE